ncbi:MAG: S1-like domain-containing RNA-binding protein [Kangiellaceae bacterium]|jgi:predicted RNA-binding protein (virulence factor B family)|nr:S1-like domain-containing RNA-binding protein [Kangiellaceae bacterium]
MKSLGQFHTLTIVEKTPFGAYLNVGGQKLVFVNNIHLPNNADIGDSVKVFLYQGPDGEIAATSEQPLATIGQFARLTVVAVNKVGAFLNWGLAKDLLIPFAEQSTPLEVDQSPLVYIYKNKADGRAVASTKIDKFIDKNPSEFNIGERVDLVIWDKSDLGIKAIINHQYAGLIHHDDIHKKLKYGQKVTGYIKNIRDDNKIDLSLSKPGLAGRDDLADKILQQLKSNDGVITITDKTSPEIIKKIFGVSKKQYKMALGKLYKEKVVDLEPGLVRLLK